MQRRDLIESTGKMGDQEQDQSGNQRIYITGFPPDATEDEVRELFSGIGVIGRVRQKRGYKDQVRCFRASRVIWI